MRRIDSKIPVLSALVKYDQADYVSFDMPGHKHGAGAPRGVLRTLGKEVFTLDKTTVISGHLDALHAPSHVIKESQALLADCFGAARSYYLFNGSAAGAQILFFVTCRPGDQVLMDGDVTPQTVMALIISGVMPVFCVNHRESGPFSPLTTATLKDSLKKIEKCRVVYLRSPSKYGKVADLAGWRAAASKADAILAVDECFGAHFKFHPGLPPNALNNGADLVIHSNRLLPFPRQTGLLHYGASYIAKTNNTEILDQAYRLFTVTSASYVMLGAMDGGRHVLAERGRKLWENAIATTTKLYWKLKKAGFRVISGAYDKGWDPCRILIWLDKQCASVKVQLKRQCGILTEQMGEWLSLTIVPGTSKQACDMLLKFLVANFPAHRSASTLNDAEFKVESWEMDVLFIREQVLSPYEAWYGDHRRVPSEQCVGETCGELVADKDSGLTYLVPGQRIEPHHIPFLKRTRHSPAGLKIVDAPMEMPEFSLVKAGDKIYSYHA